MLDRIFTLERHRVHRSRTGYWPAVRTLFLLFAIVFLTLAHSWLRRFAWAWPFILVLYERQSKFLRRAAADLFFHLLSFSILIGIIDVLLELLAHWIATAKDEVHRMQLEFIHRTIKHIPPVLTGLLIAYCLVILYFSLEYRLLRRRSQRPLSGVLLRMF